jgi:stress-induced morphogen
MAMAAQEIEDLIKDALPDAEIILQDLRGDQDHYSAKIKSRAFKGLSKVAQHQLVYKALGGRMGSQLHALALETSVNDQ